MTRNEESIFSRSRSWHWNAMSIWMRKKTCFWDTILTKYKNRIKANLCMGISGQFLCEHQQIYSLQLLWNLKSFILTKTYFKFLWCEWKKWDWGKVTFWLKRLSHAIKTSLQMDWESTIIKDKKDCQKKDVTKRKKKHKKTNKMNNT